MYKEIGQKIKRLREKNGYTLKQLAEHMGFSESYMHHMESGKRKISIEFLQNIADVFNEDISYFFVDKKMVKLEDEEVALLNLKKELDENDISLEDIKLWVEIAKSRKNNNI